MNENINLTEILKNCPKGTTFYHLLYEDVSFEGITDLVYPIQVSNKETGVILLSRKGRMAIGKGECVLFPSKDQRDWSKFTAPWLKKKKFDPKMLKPFDKVLVRDNNEIKWKIDFFSHYQENIYLQYRCIGNSYKYCIPYNYETKHLVGTNKEAPNFYKYWED